MDSIKPPWISVDPISFRLPRSLLRFRSFHQCRKPKHLKFPSCSHLGMLFLRMGCLGFPNTVTWMLKWLTVNTPFFRRQWVVVRGLSNRQRKNSASLEYEEDPSNTTCRLSFSKLKMGVSQDWVALKPLNSQPKASNMESLILGTLNNTLWSWLDWLDNHFSHD